MASQDENARSGKLFPGQCCVSSVRLCVSEKEELDILEHVAEFFLT